MKSALRVTSLIASEEDEKLAYISAKSLFLTDQEPYQSPNTTWKNSVGLGAGVVLSVLWLALASLLALSKSRELPTSAPIVYKASDYQLTNPPLYASHKEPEMIP